MLIPSSSMVSEWQSSSLSRGTNANSQPDVDVVFLADKSIKRDEC